MCPFSGMLACNVGRPGRALDDIQRIRDEQADLVAAHLPEPGSLVGAAKRLWAGRIALDWTEMCRLVPSLPDAAPAIAVLELSKSAIRFAGSAFEVLRTLCNGWVIWTRRPTTPVVRSSGRPLLVSPLGVWGFGPGVEACGLRAGETVGAGRQVAALFVPCSGARRRDGRRGVGHRRRFHAEWSTLQDVRRARARAGEGSEGETSAGVRAPQLILAATSNARLSHTHTDCPRIMMSTLVYHRLRAL